MFALSRALLPLCVLLRSPNRTHASSKRSVELLTHCLHGAAGGGNLAFTILGVDFNESSGQAEFLILVCGHVQLAVCVATCSWLHAVSYLSVPKFWTHRTKIYYFCDRSVREKAWRSRKRVAQAT